jgi:3-phosphoshikimate 1-carboxyvinyltransferase
MSATVTLTLPSRLSGTVTLPTSKSLSARALIISALAGAPQPRGLSDCDDTRVLLRALRERGDVIDILAAGTAMRFSTAFFAVTPGTHLITGTARMQQRPIRVLVDALRALGADIRYVGEEGFPPLRVSGRPLRGGALSIPAGISSQYISALLMIAPLLADGLTLTLEGDIVSTPYIHMTLALMRTYGATAEWADDHTLRVAPGGYRREVEFTVEPDWSAASYWYELVALAPDAASTITLPGLRPTSVQGDSVVWQRFRALGVATTFTDAGAVLTRTAPEGVLDGDFTACPDLAQTFVVTCALLRRPFHFTGLQSLRIKETDRIAALQHELAHLGVAVTATDSTMTLSAAGLPAEAAPATAPIATYDDHRMAMAFAPAAFRHPALSIAHPEVVSKSYPAFWDDLRQVGATVADSDTPA